MSPVLALLAASALAAPVDGDELDRRLSELSSPEAGVRHEAERWLGAHVGFEDYALLARETRRGDAEVRLRLARIVGAADPDLTLATLFLAETQPALAEVGERAIRERISRWNPHLGSAAITGGLLGDALHRRAERAWPTTLRVPLEGTLADTVALLERRADLPVGLAVEPDLGQRGVREEEGAAGLREPYASTEPPALTGVWDDLLPRLAEAFGVGLDGHGLDPREDVGRPAFLRFAEPADAGRESTVDVLLAWCRQVVGGDTPAARAAAARSLASSGWPDALAWLETRFLAGDDGAGLEGVLHAAAAGRVALALRRPAIVRRLLERADQDLAAGTSVGLARAHRIADALGHLGCRAPDGGDLGAVLFEGWASAPARSRWLRLVVAEATRCPAGAEPAREVLLDPDEPAFLRRQALRASAATGAGRPSPERTGAPFAPVVLDGAAALLATASSSRDAAEMARELVLVDLALPPEWRGPAALPGGWGPAPRVAVLGWFLGRGQLRMAGAHLRDLLARLPGDAHARGDALAGAVAPWASPGDRDRLESAWRVARESASAAGDEPLAAELDRAALLLGLFSMERRVAIWESQPREGDDLAALGVVAGWGTGRHGIAARMRLLRLLHGTLAAEDGSGIVEGAGGDERALVAALERAFHELERYGLDSLADGWARQVGSAARRSPSALGRRLRAGWPPPPAARVVDLAGLDRRLAPP